MLLASLSEGELTGAPPEIGRPRLMRRLIGLHPDPAHVPTPGEVDPELDTDACQVFWAAMAPDDTSHPHFHPVPQFQFFVSGSGRLGNHVLEPIHLHYTDGYTPYGPIVPGNDGLAFIDFRAIPDTGAYYMPESRDQMSQRAGRSVSVSLSARLREAQLGEAETLIVIPEEQDGLSAFIQVIPALGTWDVPPPSVGQDQDQYCLMLEGSAHVAGEEGVLGPLSFVVFRSEDVVRRLVAGGDGAKTLVFQFPRAAEAA